MTTTFDRSVFIKHLRHLQETTEMTQRLAAYEPETVAMIHVLAILKATATQILADIDALLDEG
jgi:putative IMPACT (imprinted ancient) family translation regulator